MEERIVDANAATPGLNQYSFSLSAFLATITGVLPPSSNVTVVRVSAVFSKIILATADPLV